MKSHSDLNKTQFTTLSSIEESGQGENNNVHGVLVETLKREINIYYMRMKVKHAKNI